MLKEFTQMKRTVKIRNTTINTMNKIVTSYGKCEELISELNDFSQKQFVGDILGHDHWICNEHGNKTCILHKANYAHYFSPEYQVFPTAYEVEVLDQSQIFKSAKALSRNYQYSLHKNEPEHVTEYQLNNIKSMLQNILLTIESHSVTHKNSK
jgi:hypothetical protein